MTYARLLKNYFSFNKLFFKLVALGGESEFTAIPAIKLDSALNPALSLLILHANPTNFSIHNNTLTNTLVIYTLSFRHYCKQHTGAYSAWLLRV